MKRIKQYPSYWLYAIYFRDEKGLCVIGTYKNESEFEQAWNILTTVADNKDLQWISLNISADIEQLI